MLSKYVLDNQRDWDVHLPLVMMAYRSSVQEATTFTPHFMMFGCEICLPSDIMLGTHVNQEPLTHGSHAATLRAETENAYQMVRTRMQRVQKRTKDYDDKNVTGSVFERGDRVRVYSLAHRKVKRENSGDHGQVLIES